jgi:hypothetical protein
MKTEVSCERDFDVQLALLSRHVTLLLKSMAGFTFRWSRALRVKYKILGYWFI